MSESVGRGVGASGNAATSAAPLSSGTYGIWRVIPASAVGTMIEWYDFYIFGSLAAVLSPKFYPPGNDTFAYIAYLATFAVGFLVRPFGALFFGRIGDLVGRKYAFLVTLFDHGRRDGGDRLAADLQDRGMVCADYAAADSRAARTGARRRVWRRGGLCRASTCPTASAASTRASSRSRRRWDCSCRCW